MFIVLLMVATVSGTGGPVWDLHVTGARTIRVTVSGLDAADPESGPAVAHMVPAPDGVLPAAEVVRGATAQVSFGQPAVAAGLEVVPLILRRTEPAAIPGGTVELVLRYDRPLAAMTGKGLMGARVGTDLGLAERDGGIEMTGYLIIVPDEFHASVLPLAAWKERKGLTVWVKRTSETGTTKEQIQSYIAGAYRTWEPTPSYVLLVGAVNKIPAFITGGTPCVTDHPYACVDGSDYLADLFVGRFPAANTSELDVMVAKTVGYEASPYTAETDWFRRALMVGTSYQEGGTPAVTALVTKRWVREYMFTKGFSEIDTVFYPPVRYGRGPVDTAVNRGVLFVNGRGWGNYDGWGYPQFLVNDVYGLANGWKLPVVTSIYCGTGNFQRNPCFGEAWLRAGTPSSPRGAVAFWGSSYTGTSTRWNNCMDYAIYRAIFDGGERACGPAMYQGKLAQLENFPLAGDSFDLRLYFHVYNLMGDPALAMWTGVPRALNVSYPSTVPSGASAFEVQVLDAGSVPVVGATVCLYRSGRVQEVVRTGASGRVRFAVPVAVTDSMLVTVTGPDLVPHLGRVSVVTSEVFVGHLNHGPDTVGPGALSLDVTLKNFGSSQTATGVRATLRALDNAAVVTDSVRDYGDLSPGGTATSSPFELAVASSCTSGQRVPLALIVTSGVNTWESGLRLTARAPTLETGSYTVHDANGVLDPGETAELSVLVRNRGSAGVPGLTGVLRSLNPAAVAVLDSNGSFGDLAPGESLANTGDRFMVRASSGIGAGRRFTMRLVLRGGSVEQVWDFPLTVGAPASSTPLGPDRHGYYAYDDVDAGYAERPDFAWFEIDPAQGGSGMQVSLRNDTAVPVQLPFTFRFYGREYSTISVSDNGFLAMGNAWLSDVYNWSIPSPMGPDGKIAVFWDDFRTDTLGAAGLFTYHDQDARRFVVEWSRCVHMHGFRPPYPAEQQTFQVMLYDPQYYPTRTGDGPILAQYRAVQDDDTLWGNNHNFATVGIESPDHRDGLECTFAGMRPAAVAALGPNRAIRFTTNPPDTFTPVVERWPDRRAVKGFEVRPSLTRGPVTCLLPADAGAVNVDITDVLGRVVRVAAAAGPDWQWDLADNAGRRVPAGVYRITLTGSAGGHRLSSTRIAVLD